MTFYDRIVFQPKSRKQEDLEEEAKGMTTWFADRDGKTVGIYGLEVEE